MLSQDLEALQQWFEAARLNGEGLSAEGAKAFSDALKAAVETAVALESAAVAPIYRLQDGQIEEVIIFPVVPRQTAFQGRRPKNGGNDGGDRS